MTEYLRNALQFLVELTGLTEAQMAILTICASLLVFAYGVVRVRVAKHIEQQAHRKREFHQQVVIQRHVHQRDGDVVRMGIRTIWSGTLNQIFAHDPVMQDKIIAAARRTTKENPFIVLGDRDVQAIMIQTFVNFTGWKLPRTVGPHVLCVTAEADAGRSRKIRVLLLGDSGEDSQSQVYMYGDTDITIKADNEELQGPRVDVLRKFAAATVNDGKHGTDVVVHVVAPAWAEEDDAEIHVSTR